MRHYDRRSFLTALLFLSGFASELHAAGTVVTCDDPGLRTALVGGGLVNFNCDGVITLATTLVIQANTVIDATGHNITLDGNNTSRHFWVNSSIELTITNLTLANGMARGADGPPAMSANPGYGGSIYNEGGTIYLFDCVFTGNTARGGNGGNETSLYGTSGSGGRAEGGAIYNQAGTVTASHCLFVANQALAGSAGSGGGSYLVGTDAAGGAIMNISGTVSLFESRLIGNHVKGGLGNRFYGSGYPGGRAAGGALCSSNATTVLSQTVLERNFCEPGNSVSGYGGAIQHIQGDLSILQCVVRDNLILGGYGIVIGTPLGIDGGSAHGGGANLVSAFASIEHSTFSFNHAQGGDQGSFGGAGHGLGGAISMERSRVDVVNSTIYSNMAKGGVNRYGDRGASHGAGLLIESSTADVAHVSCAFNLAHDGINPPTNFIGLGGSIYSGSGSLVTLHASILAHSYLASNVFGTVHDAGFNLNSDTSFTATNTGSSNLIDPILGPLSDYGGPTPTLPLLTGSPAMDGGPNSGCLATDQRGRSRPFGAACDVGAFESSPPFVIRGAITGPHVTGGILVDAGTINTSSTLDGRFNLVAPSSGNYMLTPSDSDYHFVPSNQLVAVNGDIIDVTFDAYRWHTLVQQETAGNAMTVAMPAPVGGSYHLAESTDLASWSIIGTNTVSGNNFLYFDQVMTKTNSFLRTQPVP
ncbi:MAG TPA: choice-of-anchor Q domain-containing protein [Kiritimatiellia bacterium]|nr:choice-of-anchor Q domain-containing protein [Kiritimatiellia bacterium]HMP35609.1 choice-of-anchor Q domain-containing protein [Kiritimatiellia bacterium]